MSIQKSKAMLVNDVMLLPGKIPIIKQDVILKGALEEMGRFRLGIACIVNDKNKLLGILTDGDFRRKLLKVQKPLSALFVDDAINHAILAPLTIQPGATLVEAVGLMESKQVWDLPVVDDHGSLLGLLHLHPAIQALLEL